MQPPNARPSLNKIIALLSGITVFATLLLAAGTIDFPPAAGKIQSPYGQINFEKVLREKNPIQIAFSNHYSHLVHAVFHEAISPKVLCGQDDWLYYTAEMTIEDMLGTSPCQESLKTAWAKSIKQRANWLANQGIAYRVVMVPEKHSVYPEFLPDRVKVRLATSRFQQIADFMGASPWLVDLRPALINAKVHAKNRLYIHTDTHWTNLGAYKGYRYIMQSLGEPYWESTTDLPDSDAITGEAITRDLARYNGLDGMEDDVYFPAIFGPAFSFRRGQVILPDGYTTANFPLGVFSTLNENREKSIVVFRDSFACSMEPFISSSFYRASYYWATPSDDLFHKVIELERPDVVIEERAERYFKDAPEADLEKKMEKYAALLSDSRHARDHARLMFMNAFLRGRFMIARQESRAQMFVNNVRVADVIDDLPIEGAVESAGQASGKVTITGWTGSPGQDRPVDCILVVKAGTVLYVAPVGEARAEIAASHSPELEQSRFALSFPLNFVPVGDGPIELYAIMGQSARLLKAIGPADMGLDSTATVGNQ